MHEAPICNGHVQCGPDFRVTGTSMRTQQEAMVAFRMMTEYLYLIGWALNLLQRKVAGLAPLVLYIITRFN